MENYALELIQKGTRIDERKFDQYRNIEIKTGVIGPAEGSARVRIGDTEVIVGVKMNTGTPFSDMPNDGTMMVSAEFTPLASPDFESGPPGEDAIELARLVDRSLRESKCIDFSKLVITPGVKVWSVYIDIHIINHQGNLLDAAGLAAVAALWNAYIPKYENEKIVRGEPAGKLPISFKPITITVGKVGNTLLVDPVLEEESIIDAKMSIAIRDDGKICAMQKQGHGTLEFSDVDKMIDIALKKSEELRGLI
ncbi:exosome complex protein Rrp42 [archaeon]|nr:MAG: exosome complex protein Rrp42 [archaeon]